MEDAKETYQAWVREELSDEDVVERLGYGLRKVNFNAQGRLTLEYECERVSLPYKGGTRRERKRVLGLVAKLSECASEKSKIYLGRLCSSKHKTASLVSVLETYVS